MTFSSSLNLVKSGFEYDTWHEAIEGTGHTEMHQRVMEVKHYSNWTYEWNGTLEEVVNFRCGEGFSMLSYGQTWAS